MSEQNVRLVRVPDLPTPIRIGGRPARRPNSVVHRLQFSADERHLAAWIGPDEVGKTGRPGTDEICWLDSASGKVVRRTGQLNDGGFDPYPNWDPAVSPDLQLAALLDIDGFSLTLQDSRRSATGERRLNIPFHEVGGFCFSSDGWLVTVGYQGERAPAFREPAACQIVRCNAAELLSTPPPKFKPSKVPNPFKPGEFITLTRPPLLDPWQVIADLPDRSAEAKALAIAPDGTTVAVGSDGGTIWVFKLPSGRRTATLRVGSERRQSSAVHRIVFSREGGQLVALDDEGVAARPLGGRTRGWRSDSRGAARDIAIRADTGAVLLTNRTDFVFELNPNDGRERWSYYLQCGPLFGLAVSPTGRTAAAGTFNGGIAIWELMA